MCPVLFRKNALLGPRKWRTRQFTSFQFGAGLELGFERHKFPLVCLKGSLGFVVGDWESTSEKPQVQRVWVLSKCLVLGLEASSSPLPQERTGKACPHCSLYLTTFLVAPKGTFLFPGSQQVLYRVFLQLPEANTLHQIPLASNLDNHNRITISTHFKAKPLFIHLPQIRFPARFMILTTLPFFSWYQLEWGRSAWTIYICHCLWVSHSSACIFVDINDYIYWILKNCARN